MGFSCKCTCACKELLVLLQKRQSVPSISLDRILLPVNVSSVQPMLSERKFRTLSSLLI